MRTLLLYSVYFVIVFLLIYIAEKNQGLEHVLYKSLLMTVIIYIGSLVDKKFNKKKQ